MSEASLPESLTMQVSTTLPGAFDHTLWLGLEGGRIVLSVGAGGLRMVQAFTAEQAGELAAALTAMAALSAPSTQDES